MQIYESCKYKDIVANENADFAGGVSRSVGGSVIEGLSNSHVHNIELSPAESVGKDRIEKSNFLKNLSLSRSSALSLAEALCAQKSYPSLIKVGKKLKNCSVFGAFRSLPTDEHFKIGQAMCKSRICPVCAGVLSMKRRNNAISFFQDNQENLRGYNFYHLVLTLKHNKKVRNYYYAKELVDYLSILRGTGKTTYAEWDSYVDGGFHSVECSLGRNRTPHIHAHILLMSKTNLIERGFDKWVRKKWRAITGNSYRIKLEPIYFLDENRNKVYYDSSIHSVAYLQRAFSECLKYTIKPEFGRELKVVEGKVGGFPADFVDDLLTTRVRLFSRFGCLYNHKGNNKFVNLHKLATDYKDLENVEVSDALLCSPDTGEIFEKHQTKLSMTPFHNTKVVSTNEVVSYKFIDSSQVSTFSGESLKPLSIELAKTIKGRYRTRKDFLTEE